MRPRSEAGMTVMEVLIAIAFLGIALMALLTLLLTGYLDVSAGGRVSKTTSYARQMMEQLRNQPFTPALPVSNDTPETGITRTWTIAPVGATLAPNRLARITVTVTANQTAGIPSSSRVDLETMRAE
jgi:Tfp pilus assembly protein PilV